MMLYTILDPNDVFGPGGEAPAAETRREGSRFFEGERADGVFTIRRVISTDPADYLNENYAPGKRLL